MLELEGRRIGDSTAIIAALEEYRPDPPLYPADPAERARALELEEFFDERLAPSLRRYAWYHMLGDSDATVSALVSGTASRQAKVLRALLPLARPAVRRDYGVNDASAERALGEIRASMDRLEAELQPSGYLVGNAFSVADLTAASLFTPVLAPPQRPYARTELIPPLMELREELAAREGGEWVAEMYARHRGTSAEIAA